MRTATLIRRNLTHFWRTNLAVVLGVATTVAVLAGALLVGDSVRASLRDLFLERLGRTSQVIVSDGFFRETLAVDLQKHPRFVESFEAAVPLIVLEGLITHEKSGRRASSVHVYGVDERFWQFHRGPESVAPKGREILLSRALATEFGAAPGDSILVRMQKPSDVPIETLHGRKDDLGRTLRFTLREVLSTENLGEFSIRPQQGEVRAVFVPLRGLQEGLKQEARANGILVSNATETQKKLSDESAALTALLKQASTLEDFGLRLEVLEKQRAISLESDRILLDDRIAEAARQAAAQAGLQTTSLFTYLANSIRIGDRQIPYSLVTAMDEHALANLHALGGMRADSVSQSFREERPPVWLNAWAMRDLGARPGDTATLEYYIWEESGHLRTETTQFELRGGVPMERGDPLLAPQFPGIADSPSLSGWDPPFPIDLKRVRPQDEDYWKTYRTTPKAFIPLEAGQRLWRSRFGQLTALRFTPAAGVSLQVARDALQKDLRDAIDPLQAGFAVHAVRAEGAQASEGAVNFGEYFVYFSFFLVVAAVLLTGLFFKLGVEQRLREIGLLRAVGFPPEKIATVFLAEGAVLSVIGSGVGLAGAVVYGWLMMYGLRTWWVEAVGTTLLRLHILPISLALGGASGIAAALVCIAWTLRGLRAYSALNLLAGATEAAPLATTGEGATQTQRSAKTILRVAVACAVAGLAVLGAAALGRMDQVPGFFGSATLLLTALVCFQWTWLVRSKRRLLAGGGLAGLAQMGVRNATWRPGRSLLCIALIASATFVIVAVDAFRRDAVDASSDPKSGTGGFPFLAESSLPIPYDLNTPAGRESLGLSGSVSEPTVSSAKFVSFRVRPGEDTSCLNLYQPRNPKILGVPSALVHNGRFSFQESLARTPEEKSNSWLLLEAESADGVIPAIVDANSLTYVLHRKLGDEIVLDPNADRPVRLRLVAALRDTVFQGELLISEKNFLRVFPNEPGFRFFLIDVPPQRAAGLSAALEEGLSDFGFDVAPAGDRLATFHRVENTYLSTFQALGGLGLLLGTLGLAAVLLRNVLERRRELALLRAVGYRPAHLAFLVLSENALLLCWGLLTGVATALLAIAPALASRGGTPPVLSMAALLAAVLLVGLMASLLAVAAALRAPLVATLRSE